MTTRRLITVTTELRYYDPRIDCPAEQMLANLHAMLNEVPVSCIKNTAKFEPVMQDDHGEVKPGLMFSYCRPETDDELAVRQIAEHDTQESVALHNRAVLSRRLSKHGSHSTGSRTRDHAHPENV